MIQRNQLSDVEILKSIKMVSEKIDVRLIEKHRGAYVGNHETYGSLAEEFKELLDAMQADDNMGFYAELVDIAVACILGMASMYANKKRGE